MHYQIVNEALSWSYIFGQLERNRSALNIVDYSISQTTLEQVKLLSSFLRSKSGTLVRALAFYVQCGPGFPGTPVFPLLKNQNYQLPFRSVMVDEEPLCECATFESLCIFLCICQSSQFSKTQS